MLLDYSHAHYLPLQYQQYILHLALRIYNPETLVNRAYYIDDGRKILPPSSPISNAFYDIDTIVTSNNLNVNVNAAGRSISISGEMIPITKVMVCTSEWINEMYIESIRNLQVAFTNANNVLKLRYA